MIDELTPPPMRDIPEDRARQMRADLMSVPESGGTMPRSRRSWLVAAVAAVAVVLALVLAAQLVRAQNGRLQAEPISPPTVSAAPSTNPLPSGVVMDDLGPLDEATVEREVRDCWSLSHRDLGPTLPGLPLGLQVHLARLTAAYGPVVLFSAENRSYLCQGASEPGGEVSVRDEDPRAPTPDAARPALSTFDEVADRGRSGPEVPIRRQVALVVRTTDRVRYVDVRIRVGTVVSPWHRAEVHEGYVVATAAWSTPADTAKLPYGSEKRALDANGHEVPITQS